VGGPDTAGGGGEFLRDFLEHCLRGTNHATGAKGTPTDFLAFHAKGQPKYLDGHVQMGIARHLQTIDGAMAIIASFPEFKKTPIVIGESDPEGCAACQGPQLGYRNGTMYSSYTAASFARKHDLAEKHGVNLEGALTWAFEFEDQPYFAGFRALASNGIDLAVLNVFRMFGKMGGRRLGVQSSGERALDAIVQDGVRGAPDVSALASLEGKKLSVMLWHYHDDDLPGPDAAVDLALVGLPLPSGEARVTHFRIDDGHSNPYAVWKRMGSPIAPNADQYKELQAASELARMNDPATARVEKGQVSLRFSLPRQAVSLVVLEW
jgi:xylan 1,4-beta-xylosidase